MPWDPQHPPGRLVVLDGGLATELERVGFDLADPLWSARVLLEAPAAMGEIHRSYVSAGADIITTATYQATFQALAARGYDETAATQVFRDAVELVRQVIATSGVAPRPWVAGSIGSYGAFLADGSEYRGRYGRTRTDLADFHRRRLHVLASLCDVIACETIPSPIEGDALAEVLGEIDGARAWVSFSCCDERHTSDGERLRDAIRSIASVPQIVAVGVNCMNPRWVVELLNEATAVTTKPLIVYPNAGEHFSGAWSGHRQSPAEFAMAARAWLDAGARIIGGCCRTTPEHIGALARFRDAL